MRSVAGAIILLIPVAALGQECDSCDYDEADIGLAPAVFEEGVFSRVDLSGLCSNQENIALEGATKILGVSLLDKTCTSVFGLMDRGFSCEASAEAFLPSAGFGGGPILDFTGMYAELRSVHCSQGESLVSLEYGYEVARVDLTTDHIVVHKNPAGTSPSESAYVTVNGWNYYWQEAMPEVLNSIPVSISFDCRSIGSCQNTGEQLANYLVNQARILDEMKVEHIAGGSMSSGVYIYRGFTQYGEIVIVSPAEYLGPRLIISEGNLREGRSGLGMSIE